MSKRLSWKISCWLSSQTNTILSTTNLKSFGTFSVFSYQQYCFKSKQQISSNVVDINCCRILQKHFEQDWCPFLFHMSPFSISFDSKDNFHSVVETGLVLSSFLNEFITSDWTMTFCSIMIVPPLWHILQTLSNVYFSFSDFADYLFIDVTMIIWLILNMHPVFKSLHQKYIVNFNTYSIYAASSVVCCCPITMITLKQKWGLNQTIYNCNKLIFVLIEA